jgi:hypothetical protein
LSDYSAAYSAPTTGTTARAEGLFPAPTSAIRARLHPWALVGVWAWESAIALAASWPAASLVQAAYGGHARGDGPLWDAGGHVLLDLMWHEAPALSAITRAAALSLAFALVAGLVPLASMMTALAYETRHARHAGLARSIAAGIRTFAPFAALLVLFGLAEGIAVGAGMGASTLVEGLAHVRLGEGPALLTEGCVAVPFLLGVSIVGVMHDLARAAVVRTGVGALRGAVIGARTFGAAGLSWWWAWAWRQAAGLAVLAAGAAAAGRLGGRGGMALLGLALVHQLGVFLRVALRASWLARALRGAAASAR